MHVDRRRQRGAALLLLLSVSSIAFAAVLIGAFSRGDLERRRQQQTLQHMAAARDALMGFAATNGRLPRPAVSATDGRETAQVCADEAACSGFLPWVTLGIDGSDSWGKRLRYSVTPLYTIAPIVRLSAVPTKRLLSRDGNGELRYVVGQETCTLATDCAPAVIFSQGRDNLGTGADGRPRANGTRANVDELSNDEGVLAFVQRPATTDPRAAGGPFDDMLVALPLQRLYDRMAAAGTLP